MASKAATQPAQAASGGTSEQALATVDVSKGQVPALLEEGISGPSDFGQKDLSVPFLRILQALSPHVQPQDPKYDEDAKQGQIVETVSPKFYEGDASRNPDAGLIIIPVAFTRSYTEWKQNRGGMVADHGSDPAILAKCQKIVDSQGKTKMVTQEGTEVAEAALYYVLYAEYHHSTPGNVDSEWRQALMTMAGTQWRKSRDWNTNMSRVRISRADGSIIQNPLPFVHSYRFTTVGEKKDNYNFFGWKIEPHIFTLALPGGEDLLRKCIEFRKLALAGAIKGDDGGAEDPELQEGKTPF
jgi:hypothetical protein